MRILLASHLFWPSIGGIEQVSGILAQEWAALGHDVTVVTTTAGESEHGGYRVFRKPNNSTLVRCTRESDLCFQSNISLRTFWSAILARVPVVITHHTWIARPNGRRKWQDFLKLAATRIAVRNLAVSKAVAESVAATCDVIANPFQDHIFRRLQSAEANRDLIFVGRLVSDKGVDICLEAVAKLRNRSLTPTFTIVGSGPEEHALRQQCSNLGLQEQVRFVGNRTGQELATLLNQHRIIVVPSRWSEPFGLVALEGIACGCVAVGSAGGGLSDAIGRCGVTFPNGDVEALTGCLEELLRDPSALETFHKYSSEHLAKHHRRAVAERYLEIFEEVLSRK